MSVKSDTGLQARVRPSPNHGPRAGSGAVDMVILHYTGMKSADAALQRLCDPRAEVSAHYVIFEDGTLYQCVPESRRAWHSGRSLWKGEADVNSRSIGIELVNPGHEHGYHPFPGGQISVLIDLVNDVCRRHAIQPWCVLGHSDVAPDRKMDPGELFPWAQLAGAGIGHWVEPTAICSGIFMQQGDQGQPVEALQSMLGLYGYGIEVSGTYDLQTLQVVTAFQRHFRPEKVDGVADRSTVATLHSLLSALPAVD